MFSVKLLVVYVQCEVLSGVCSCRFVVTLFPSLCMQLLLRAHTIHLQYDNQPVIVCMGNNRCFL